MAGKTHIEPALIEQYILGLTTEAENREIGLYLAQNPAIAKEVKGNRIAIEDFAMEFTIDLPKKIKNGKPLKPVKSTLQVEPSVAPKVKVNWLTGIAAIFALGFALMSLLLYQQQSNLQNKIASLKNNVDLLQGQNAQLVNQKTQLNQQFSFVKDVNTAHVHLKGASLSPKALIVVYWNEATKDAYLNVVDLPKIPADKSLQLWADVEGKMINMGILETGKAELMKVPYMPNVESLNITLEPKGGSEQPNVEQLYANGKLL